MTHMHGTESCMWEHVCLLMHTYAAHMLRQPLSHCEAHTRMTHMHGIKVCPKSDRDLATPERP